MTRSVRRRSVVRSIIISLKGGKFHFQDLIGRLANLSFLNTHIAPKINLKSPNNVQVGVGEVLSPGVGAERQGDERHYKAYYQVRLRVYRVCE